MWLSQVAAQQVSLSGGGEKRTIEEVKERVREGWSVSVGGFQTLLMRAIENAEITREDGNSIWPYAEEMGVGSWWFGRTVAMASATVRRTDTLDVEHPTRSQVESRKHAWKIFESLRKHVSGFESPYMMNAAPTLGIRENRRIMGEHVLTEEDVLKGRTIEDAIGKSPGRDQRYYALEGYDVPYRRLVPKNVDGLLVCGRCMSVEAPRAFDASRGSVSGTATGQAAGTAAALAVKSQVSPREVSIPELQVNLRKQGVIL